MRHHGCQAEQAHRELAAQARVRRESLIETAYRLVLDEHGP